MVYGPVSRLCMLMVCAKLTAPRPPTDFCNGEDARGKRGVKGVDAILTRPPGSYTQYCDLSSVFLHVCFGPSILSLTTTLGASTIRCPPPTPPQEHRQAFLSQPTRGLV